MNNLKKIHKKTILPELRPRCVLSFPHRNSIPNSTLYVVTNTPPFHKAVVTYTLTQLNIPALAFLSDRITIPYVKLDGSVTYTHPDAGPRFEGSYKRVIDFVTKMIANK